MIGHFLRRFAMGKAFGFLKLDSRPKKSRVGPAPAKDFPVIKREGQDQIELRLAAREDALEMVTFHNSYYGKVREPEHWLWEYQTYAPDKAVFAFARHHGRLIATQGFLPVHIEVGNECVLSGKSENTLLLPPYRGSTVMSGLYEYAVQNCIDRGMQFMWGFTPVVKGFKRMGINYYPDIEVLTRTANLRVEIFLRWRNSTPVWRRVGSIGKLVLDYILLKTRQAFLRIEKGEGYEIRKGQIPEEALSELHARIKMKHKNIIWIKYDEKYLSWRVRKHPFLKYDEYQVYQAGKLRAYAFTALSEGTASVSDLVSEDTRATSLLLDAIIKDYEKKAGQFRLLRNGKDPLGEYLSVPLREFGFSVDEKTSKTWNFGLRDFSNGKRAISDIRNWHISSLWTEGFRY
jgi:hypothetical protein